MISQTKIGDEKMSTGNEGLKRVKMLHIAIVFLLMFGFRYIPPVGEITVIGMQVLGVFFGCLWGWIFCGSIGWPSLLGVVALGLTDYITMPELFASGFGSQNAILVLCLLIITAFIEQAGLSNIIVNFMLTRKFTNGKPWLIVYSFFLASFVASVVSFINASALLFIELFRVLMRNVGIQPYSKQVPVFLVGISLSSVLGELAFPFKTSGILYIGAYAAGSGETFNFLTFSLYNISMCVLLLGVYVLMCKYLLRIDMSMLQEIGTLPGMDKKITFREKVSLGAVGVILVSLLLPNILPAEWGFTKLLSTMGLGGMAAFLTVMLTVIHIDGEPLLNFMKVAPCFKWDCYFLVVILFPIATALMADSTGLKLFLSNNLSAIAMSLPLIICVIFMLASSAIITNFANNIVVGALFISLANILSGALPGLNVAALAILLMFSCSASIFFPAASPCNAMCFAQTDIVNFSQEFKLGLITTAVMVVVLVVVGWPTACLVF